MKIRRIDFSPDEWIAGTVGLSNAERGLYITACALIYSHGGPIPEVELRRSCRDHGHAYKRQLGCLVSAGKLTVNDGQIANKRCTNELEKAHKRSTNAKQNISKRWENNSVADDPVLQAGNANHQPSTTKEEDSDANASGADAPVAAPDPTKQLWDRGLAIVGAKQRSLLGKLVSRHGKVAVLGAIVETDREQPVDPVAYFINCCERRQNGRGDPTHAYELLAQAAIDYDDRQNRRGPAEAVD